MVFIIKMIEIFINPLRGLNTICLSVIPEFTKLTDKHLVHMHQSSSMNAILMHISTAVVQQVNAARDEEITGEKQ